MGINDGDNDQDASSVVQGTKMVQIVCRFVTGTGAGWFRYDHNLCIYACTPHRDARNYAVEWFVCLPKKLATVDGDPMIRREGLLERERHQRHPTQSATQNRTKCVRDSA